MVYLAKGMVESGAIFGFVVPSKNPKALADVIIRFYKNKKKKEFSVNIKKLKDKYSWKHYCDIIESL